MRDRGWQWAALSAAAFYPYVRIRGASAVFGNDAAVVAFRWDRALLWGLVFLTLGICSYGVARVLGCHPRSANAVAVVLVFVATSWEMFNVLGIRAARLLG